MKRLIFALLCLFSLSTINAQSYYLQAENRYVKVREDGTAYLSYKPSTQVYLGLDDRIYTTENNLYLRTDLQNNREIRFVPAEAEADKPTLEDHFNDKGKYITKRFFEGTLYLSVYKHKLEWRKKTDDAVPVLLKSSYRVETEYREALRKRQEKEAADAKKREDDAIAKAKAAAKAKAEAAAKAKAEAAAAAKAAAKAKAEEAERERQRQSNGTIVVELKNFKGNYSDYYVLLDSDDHPDVWRVKHSFNARFGWKVRVSGLKDGTYQVKLFKKYGGEKLANCECTDDLSGYDEVTILNGDTETVPIKANK